MTTDHKPVVWVLEQEVFPETHEAFHDAVLSHGHAARIWKDEWWIDQRWPRLEGAVVVFHGSLGNAHQIRGRLPWRPGAFCETAAFNCSAWYPHARPWLVHREWRVVSALELTEAPGSVLRAIGDPALAFVRPDSPLKPFSGRVLPADAITLKALDCGFYYDDPTIPVVVAPVRVVEREWRYVVVERRIVAGCEYSASRQSAKPDQDGSASWQFASGVAAQLQPPEDVYVMDICEADGALWLLELNPFSGADLYSCSAAAVVTAVSRAAARRLAQGPSSAFGQQ